MINVIDKISYIASLIFLVIALVGLVGMSISIIVDKNKRYNLLEPLLIVIASWILIIPSICGGVDNTSTITEASGGLKGAEVDIIDEKKYTIGDNNQLEEIRDIDGKWDR